MGDDQTKEKNQRINERMGSGDSFESRKS